MNQYEIGGGVKLVCWCMCVLSQTSSNTYKLVNYIPVLQFSINYALLKNITKFIFVNVTFSFLPK